MPAKNGASFADAGHGGGALLDVPHAACPGTRLGMTATAVWSRAMRTATAALLALLALGCAGSPKPAAAAPATPAAATAARTETLTAEDIVSMVSVSDVALSPDGKTVAFVRRTPRTAMEARGGARSIIWLVPAKGGDPVRFTAPDRSSFAPKWSPDGKWLAFRSSRSGDVGAQVYRISPKGGEPERLTDVEGGVSHFEWSPDGKRIAFTAKAKKTKAQREADEAGRDWRLTDVKGTEHRLYVFEPGSDAAPAVVGSAAHHVSGFAWAPDSARLVVRASERADVDAVMMYSRLFVADLGGAWTQLTKTEGKLGAFAWSPDGKRIAFLGAVDITDPTSGVLHVVDAAGGTAKALTADYEGTGSAVFWPRDAEIVLLANQGTRTALLGIHPDSAKRKALSSKGPVCRKVHLDAKAKSLACAGSTGLHPSEVFVGGVGKSLRRVTDSNPWLAKKTLGKQEVVGWKAADGTAIEGVLIHPVGAKKGAPAPLAVLPHGGPEGISLDGWGTRATYPAQLFANRGFAVLMPNYRGSQGRGVAFGKADHKDLGGKEFEDVLAGIEHLSSQGIVDADRVGMGGWSYGGYFSGLAATMHTRHFKAAMVGAAITNWISFSGTTEIEHENSLVHWNLWPWANLDLAWQRSPMAHIEGSQTATLVVHGESDTRVPPGQAMELYRGLRHFGGTTEIALYPREGHGLSERAHQLDFAERFVSFFEEHVARAQ